MMLARVAAFNAREQEKRDAEAAELAKRMAENAEYVRMYDELMLPKAD